MELKPTSHMRREYPGLGLDDFLASGWTDQQLVDAGLAAVVTLAGGAILANGPDGKTSPASVATSPVPPNPFGVTSLTQVTDVWRQECAKSWPGGWSMEAHVLRVATRLAMEGVA